MIHTVLIKTENMFIFKGNIILNIYFIIAGSELAISFKITFINLCNLLWQRNGAWCAVGIKGTFSITAREICPRKIKNPYWLKKNFSCGQCKTSILEENLCTNTLGNGSNTKMRWSHASFCPVILSKRKWRISISSKKLIYYQSMQKLFFSFQFMAQYNCSC